MNIFSFSFGPQYIFENLQPFPKGINETLSPLQKVIMTIALAVIGSIAVIYAASRCWKKESEGKIAKTEISDAPVPFSSPAAILSETTQKILFFQDVNATQLTFQSTPKSNKKIEFGSEAQSKYQWIATSKKTLSPNEKTQLKEFEEGTLTGKGSLEFLDGEKWTGDFKDSLFDGYGRMDFMDGKVVEAEFEGGNIVNIIQVSLPVEGSEKEESDSQLEGLTASPLSCSTGKDDKQSPAIELGRLIEQLKCFEEEIDPSKLPDNSSFDSDSEYGLDCLYGPPEDVREDIREKYPENKENPSRYSAGLFEDEWLFDLQNDESESNKQVLEKDETLFMTSSKSDKQREQEESEHSEEEGTCKDSGLFGIATTFAPLTTIKAVDIEEQELNQLFKQSFHKKDDPASHLLPDNEMEEEEEMYLLVGGGAQQILDCSYGKIVFNDGSSQLGEYRKGKLNGVGKIIDANGDVISGNFKDGYLHGQGKIEYADGRVLLGKFSMGVLQGKGSIIFPQG